MIRNIIFDLDQTLADTSSAELLRKQGNWQAVYKLIPTFSMYPSMDNILKLVKDSFIGIAVVSSSPSGYCQRVLNQIGIEPNALVCYHDTVYHKPHPEPMLLALKKLKANFSTTVSVGDNVNDIISSNMADIYSIWAKWGVTENHIIGDQNKFIEMESVEQLYQWLLEKLNPKYYEI